MIAVEEHYGLTCGQRWLLKLLETAPELARPVQRIYRLSKDFDSSAFLEALQGTVASHPALRLQLVQTNNGWMQCFPDQEVNVSGEEVRGRTPEMRAAYAAMLIAEEAKTTLDLRVEPPVKVKIVKVDGDYLLSLCVDHLAADEIAFDLFEQELLLSYQQLVSGSSVSKTVSESFYTYLSKEIAQQDTEPANLLYWQQQLKDVPLNKDSHDEISWVPASVFNYQLTGASLQSLLNFCQKHKCSLFNVVIAFQVLLLAEVSGSDDVVLNIPVSNRARANERSIIANLSMLLHVRFSIKTNEPLHQFVLRVRDQVLTAMAHRQYNYSSLSRFMTAEAERKGFNIEWLQGCNFVVDNGPLTFPNILFEERMDNIPGRFYDVPRSSFTVAARQTKSALNIGIEWDSIVWPVSTEEMEAKFLLAVQKFSGMDVESYY